MVKCFRFVDGSNAGKFYLDCNYNILKGMAEVYLLLGSNMGNREENLEKAVDLIMQECGPVVRKSQLYETEPWGIKEQQPFINQCIAIRTRQAPLQLLKGLKSIETQVGRTDTVKWGPRIIDIDILLYGPEIVELPELRIPHPHLPARRFALEPLNEIAPDFVHPWLLKTVATLLAECKDEGAVVKLTQPH